MRLNSALVLASLLFFSLPDVCHASQSTTEAQPDLHLKQGKNRSIVLTVTNTKAKPLFFLRPDHPRHWYGWELKIAGPKGGYGYIPAPSPWIAGPESFILLNPGDSFQTTFDLSHAHDLQDRNAPLFAAKGIYKLNVAYTFDAELEIKQRTQAAQIISLLTSNNFRPHDYGFMAKASSNTIEILVR